MTDGVERLRAKRGDENVTFAQIADHLNDYCDRSPADVAVVQRVAEFLADVEDIDHDHDASATRGLA